MPTLYIPNQPEPFKLSRSKLESFIRCPYCFYLDQRLGVKQPPGLPFTLNNAVDTLLKREYDLYRAQQCPHPLAIECQLDAIPYQTNPVELIDKWRNPRKGGISFIHPATNFQVYGAVDDIWINAKGELIVIDYKATAKQGEIALDQDYHQSYKRQVELYAWLLQMNGYPVYEKAFFVYCNGVSTAAQFANCLTFKTVLLEHTLDTSWIEDKLTQAYNCLNQEALPPRSNECAFCKYLTSAENITSKENLHV